MLDKTALRISDELRQYIEAVVEEVVLEGKSFENHKRYLLRFCEVESIDYAFLEKNIANFLSGISEKEVLRTERGMRLAKTLGKDCYLSDTFLEELLKAVPLQEKDNEQEQQRLAQTHYHELMTDLVPDLVNGKERLERHAYFVKKLAHDSGWNEDEVFLALSDFLSCYAELRQEYSDGKPLSSSLKKLLSL